MGTRRSGFKGRRVPPGMRGKGAPAIDHGERVIEITVCRAGSVHLSRVLIQLLERLRIWMDCPLNAGEGPTSHGQSVA